MRATPLILPMLFGLLLGGAAHAQSLAAAGHQTCAITKTGKLKCWGVIGEFVGEPWGSTDMVKGPTERKGLANVKRVTMGREHACALVADGTARCWGYNDWGQLGNGRRLGRYPVDIPKPDLTKLFSVVGLKDASDISAGRRHTCAISQGQVLCWGDNKHRQVHATAKKTLVPQPVDGVPKSQSVACGEEHSCALTQKGAVYCWGDNSDGQLGQGKPSEDKSPPTRVALPKVSQIAALDDVTCALTKAGAVHCWGSDYNLSDQVMPSPVNLALKGKAAAIAIGHGVCARLHSGKAFCKGTMARDLTRGSSNDWTPIPLSSVDDLVLGNGHGCASTGDKLHCWGSRKAIRPELSDQVTDPTEVVGLRDVTALALGEEHSCALDKSGSVWCWGGSRYTAAPKRMSALNNTRQISAGYSFACALDDKGVVRCWGNNGSGQLGRGTAQSGSANPPLPPAKVKLGAKAVHIACGSEHACATTAAGAMLCWGNPYQGRLGKLPTEKFPDSVNQPELVPGVSNAVRGAAGRCNSAMVDKSGRVQAWGCNRYGELGIGLFVKVAERQPVSGLEGKITQLALDELGCARNDRGHAWCWGDRAYTAVPFEERDIIDLDATRHACIVRSQGEVRCGRPGLMRTVKGLPKAKSIRLGGRHHCSVLRSGRVRCWGNRDSGRLGDGIADFINTPQPIQL